MHKVIITFANYTVSGQLVTADGSQDGVLSSRLTVRRMFALFSFGSTADQITPTLDGPGFSVGELQPGLYRFSARIERIAAMCGLVELLVTNSAVEAVRIPMSTCVYVEVQAK